MTEQTENLPSEHGYQTVLSFDDYAQELTGVERYRKSNSLTRMKASLSLDAQRLLICASLAVMKMRDDITVEVGAESVHLLIHRNVLLEMFPQWRKDNNAAERFRLAGSELQTKVIQLPRAKERGRGSYDQVNVATRTRYDADTHEFHLHLSTEFLGEVMASERYSQFKLAVAQSMSTGYRLRLYEFLEGRAKRVDSSQNQTTVVEIELDALREELGVPLDSYTHGGNFLNNLVKKNLTHVNYCMPHLQATVERTPTKGKIRGARFTIQRLRPTLLPRAEEARRMLILQGVRAVVADELVVEYDYLRVFSAVFKALNGKARSNIAGSVIGALRKPSTLKLLDLDSDDLMQLRRDHSIRSALQRFERIRRDEKQRLQEDFATRNLSATDRACWEEFGLDEGRLARQFAVFLLKGEYRDLAPKRIDELHKEAEAAAEKLV